MNVRRIFAIAAMSALAACALPPPGTMTWPMYQNGTTHNAIVASSLGGVKWARDLHAKSNGGIGYDGVRLYVDDFNGKLWALDPQTGKPVWQASADDVLMSTPVVAENMVFVGSGTNNALIDTPSQTLWGRKEGNHWYAFDARSGKMVWSIPFKGEAMPSPAYDSGRLIVATGDNVATSVLASNGNQLWQTPLPGVPMMAGAMVSNGTVFVLATQGKSMYASRDRSHTLALRTSDGKIVWSAPYGVSDGTPVVAEGRVFVSGEFDGPIGPLEAYGYNEVYSLDQATGALRWRFRSGNGYFTVVGSNERAITGTYDGGTLYQPIAATSELIAFRASDGAIRWRIHTAGSIKMSPLVYKGKVYVGDTNGMLYVLDANAGTPLGVYPYPKSFTTAPPIIVGGTLFIIATDTVYAVPLASL